MLKRNQSSTPTDTDQSGWGFKVLGRLLNWGPGPLLAKILSWWNR